MWAGTPNFYRVCIGEVFCFWTLHRSELCHVWLGYITCEQAHEISAEYAQGGFSIFNFASLKGCFRTADREVEAQMGYICMFIPVYTCVHVHMYINIRGQEVEAQMGYTYTYIRVYMCVHISMYIKYTWPRSWGVDGVYLSRLLKIIGLFCKRAL